MGAEALVEQLLAVEEMVVVMMLLILLEVVEAVTLAVAVAVLLVVVNLEVVAQDLYILMQKMDHLHKVTMALVLVGMLQEQHIKLVEQHFI